jgi:hypothetical protein
MHSVTDQRAEEGAEGGADDDARVVLILGARHAAEKQRPADRTMKRQTLRHTLADPDALDEGEWHTANLTERLQLHEQTVRASRDKVADDVIPAIGLNPDAPAEGKRTKLGLWGLSRDGRRVEESDDQQAGNAMKPRGHERTCQLYCGS